MDITSYDEFLAPCCQIARDAGKLIMGYYTDGYETRSKGEAGPVTDADVAANDYITRALSKLASQIPVVAEEDETLSAGGHALFWLVDPLDGTKSFVRGEAEFTVNIGLIKNGAPVLGIIYAPPQETLYWGSASGAFKQIGDGRTQKISARAPAAEGFVVVRSRSHPSPKTASFLETVKVKEMIASSSSIKLCMIAEGAADLYPRLGRTMEWDTAAGHAILLAAGGRVETMEGEPLSYGKPGFENPHFVARGK